MHAILASMTTKGWYPHARWCRLTMMLLSLWWPQRMIYPHARWCVHTQLWHLKFSSTFSTRLIYNWTLYSSLLAAMRLLWLHPCPLCFKLGWLTSLFLRRSSWHALLSCLTDLWQAWSQCHSCWYHIYESYQREPTSTTLVATATSCNVDLN